jgi:Domain of unknown function (DUF5658)
VRHLFARNRFPKLIADDRRQVRDRRKRRIWSVFYGHLQPRRLGKRRQWDPAMHSVDWHSSHLLAVAIAILLLCTTDAFLTLILLSTGASEANPVMARIVHDVRLFSAIKLSVTGAGVITLVYLAQHRLFARMPVHALLYILLLGYGALIGYELSMLNQPIDLPIL